MTERSAEWIYRGVWRAVVTGFRVPDQPPSLPTTVQSDVRVFHPSRRYLSYMKLFFWIACIAIDLAILAGWIVLLVYVPWLAMLLAIPALLIAVLPDILAYIAIHLRFDTIWYAVSDRGVHLRRGIIVITEHTISLANIQNIAVRRGPIEQCFGIATLVIETAASAPQEDADPLSVGNQVVMVGLENVQELKELLLAQVRRSPTTGLGDDRLATRRWQPSDLQYLREIRDELTIN